MQTYVALLRGINVGKGHRISMKDLVAELEALDLERVKTFIASGNVWFDAPEANEMGRAREIEARLKARFGFEIPTLLRTLAEMRTVVQNNPFGKDEDREGFYRNVAFLEIEPTAEAWQEIEALVHERERIARVGREVFSLVEREPGEGGKFAIDLMGKRMKIPTTVRNWNTTQRLAQGP